MAPTSLVARHFVTDQISRERRDGLLIVQSARASSGWTIRLSGELDLSNAATLSAELEQVEQEMASGRVTIDMTTLEFIDSTGIAVLVAAHKRLNRDGERLFVVRSKATSVRRVMKITGLDRGLPHTDE